MLLGRVRAALIRRWGACDRVRGVGQEPGGRTLSTCAYGIRARGTAGASSADTFASLVSLRSGGLKCHGCLRWRWPPRGSSWFSLRPRRGRFWEGKYRSSRAAVSI